MFRFFADSIKHETSMSRYHILKTNINKNRRIRENNFSQVVVNRIITRAARGILYNRFVYEHCTALLSIRISMYLTFNVWEYFHLLKHKQMTCKFLFGRPQNSVPL